MKVHSIALGAAICVAGALPAVAGPTCGFNLNKEKTTRTTLVVNYNVGGCPAYSEPAGAKARVCIEKEGTNRWACRSFDRSNAPTVGTKTGKLQFIGLEAGSSYRAIGYYARKIGSEIKWVMTNSVILRTKP